MPAITKKSGIGFGKALKAHANDETDYGQDFTRLPADISGVAKLISAKIGVYKKGENTGKKFVQFRGSVVSPEYAVDTVKALENGKVVVKSSERVRVAGRQTSIMCPIDETMNRKKEVTSQEDNCKAMLNEIRKLAGPEATAPLAECDDGQEETTLKEILDSLVSEDNPILFSFVTNAPDPTPANPNFRVFERWLGNQGVEEFASVNGQATAAAQTDSTAEAAEPGAVEVSGDEPEDLDALAALADKKEPEAVRKLGEMALSLGISAEDIENADDWSSVVAMINAAAGGEPEPVKPKKGQVYDYQVLDAKGKPPISPKTKKPIGPIEVEVVAVNKNDTVNLKNVANPKLVYNNVKFDRLIPKS